eukprot:71549_1
MAEEKTESKQTSLQQLLDEGFSMEEAKNAIAMSNNVQNTSADNWPCPRCTLLNKSFRAVCETCGQIRADYKEKEHKTKSKQHKCFCGKYLVEYNDASTIYSTGSVFCDECKQKYTKNDIIWHCNRNRAHPNGFDICNNKCIKQFNPITFRSKVTEQRKKIQMFQRLLRQNNIQKIQMLNIDSKQSNATLQDLMFSTKKDHKLWMISENCKQIIIIVEFNTIVDLHCIEICALPESITEIEKNENNENKNNENNYTISTPKHVHIYRLRNNKNVLDTIQSSKPDQTAEIKSHILSIDGISDKEAKFKSIQFLAICITADLQTKHKTYFNTIKINTVSLKKQNDVHICICGQPLQKITNALVQKCICAVFSCKKKATQTDQIFWNCKRKNKAHSIEFNICNNCIDQYHPRKFLSVVRGQNMVSKLQRMASHIKRIRVLNFDKEASNIGMQELIMGGVINPKRYIISEHDAELLILIEFKYMVKLNLLRLLAMPESLQNIK